MRRTLIFACLFAGCTLPAAAAPLQALIDATPAGGVLQLPPGRYAGPAVIAKPMPLDVGGRAVIDGGGRGTVLRVAGSAVAVRGVTLSGSGDSHDAMDAGIEIEGDDHRIEDNVVEGVLFGIHLHTGNRNLVARNRVAGKDLSLGMRGDGLRLWNSRNNRIEGNTFTRVRDLTLANSPDNRIVGNVLEDGRYGMHVVFSPRTVAERNRLAGMGTGIVVLYSPDVTLRGNRIFHALDGGGGGIVFKDSGGGRIEENDVVHCTAGLQADAPVNAELALAIRGNRFAHNIVGMTFYGEQGGHRITGNRFENNLTQVVTSASSAGTGNHWHGNYWSDYRGFDRNGDGVGDTPHELHAYADRIWMELPKAKFFANAPALELIDFLERLAPFSSPSLILRDAAPVMR